MRHEPCPAITITIMSCRLLRTDTQPCPWHLLNVWLLWLHSLSGLPLCPFRFHHRAPAEAFASSTTQPKIRHWQLPAQLGLTEGGKGTKNLQENWTSNASGNLTNVRTHGSDNGRHCGWVAPKSRNDDKPKTAMNDMRLHRDLKQYVLHYKFPIYRISGRRNRWWML